MASADLAHGAFAATDEVFAMRAVGNKRNRHANRFFDKMHIILRRLREFLKRANSFHAAISARQRFENRFGAVEERRRGEIFDALAVEFVRDAGGNFLEVPEHVNERERDFRRALHGTAVTCRGNIEPFIRYENG